jgi:voltage-gated potassium channel Kch
MRLVDGKEFPTFGRGLWWAAQTVTTVGYGDAVPHATSGRLVAVAVMVCALAFLTVVTGAITASLLDAGHRRQHDHTPERHDAPAPVNTNRDPHWRMR